MNKLQETLDTIVSGAFSDGMMFQAKGNLTNNDARILKDQRIDQLLQLFKDTVEKAMPKKMSIKEAKQDWGYFDNPFAELADFHNSALKQFRQNLSKILSENEVKKEKK